MLIALYRESRQRINSTTLFGISLAILTIGCLGCYYLLGFTFWYFDYTHLCILHDWDYYLVCQFSGHARTRRSYHCFYFDSALYAFRGRLATCCHASLGPTYWASLTFDPNRADVYSTQSDGRAHLYDSRKACLSIGDRHHLYGLRLLSATPTFLNLDLLRLFALKIIHQIPEY